MKKKGDMNFWLVLGVLALIFMFVVFMVMNGIISGYSESAGKVQKEITEDIDNIDLDFGESEDEATSGGS